MKITRDNYEVFFIDYFEGNLNREEKEELQQFLSQNPDLKSEFDQFEEINVAEPELEYKHKNNLKKQVSDLGEVNKDTIDEYSIAFLEGDLNEKEKADLLEAIERDESFKKSFDLFKKTKQEPDLAIVYAHKKQLKQFVLQRKVVVRWVGYAAVAAALVIGFFLIKPKLPEDTETPAIAEIEKTNPEVDNINDVDSNKTENLKNRGKRVIENKEKQAVFEKKKMAVVKKPVEENKNIEIENEQIKEERDPQTQNEFIDIAENKETDKQVKEEIQEEKTEIILPEILPELAEKVEITEEELQPENSIKPVELEENAVLAENNPQDLNQKENSEKTSNVETMENIKKNRKFDLWTLAELGVKGFNKLNETNYSLKPHYSANGEVESVTLVTEKRSITAPTI